MLLKFRLLVLQTFFETMLHEPKKSMLSTFTSALDSLIVEVSKLRLFSCNFMRVALVVVCPSASLAGLVSLSSFKHSSWLQCDHHHSEPKILFKAEPVGYTRFSPLWLPRRRKWARNFLAFSIVTYRKFDKSKS